MIPQPEARRSRPINGDVAVNLRWLSAADLWPASFTPFRCQNARMAATMLGEVEIASASYEDLPEVARIHVAAWKQAYIGQVPQAYLDNLDVADRLRRWREQFSNHAVPGLLVARVNDAMAGFVCFGPAREDVMAGWAEIYAIYALESYWGKSLGYQLYKHACAELKSKSFLKAYLWVLDTNRRAIAAYERWGGVVESDRQKRHQVGGQPVNEVSIVFALE